MLLVSGAFKVVLLSGASRFREPLDDDDDDDDEDDDEDDEEKPKDGKLNTDLEKEVVMRLAHLAVNQVAASWWS